MKKVAPPPPAKKVVDQTTMNALKSTGEDMGAEAQNRKAFLMGLGGKKTGATPTASPAPATPSTTPAPKTTTPTPSSSSSSSEPKRPASVKQASAPIQPATQSASMTFNFSFGGEAAPALASSSSDPVPEASPEPEPEHAPEPQAYTAYTYSAPAPVETADDSEAAQEAQAARERAERLALLLAESERVDAEERESTQREEEERVSITIKADEDKSRRAQLASPDFPLGRLAAKIRDTRTVTVYLASSDGEAAPERDVFISRYLPLLRNTCLPSGISLTLVDYASSRAAWTKVAGASALELALSAIDGADLVYGIHGADNTDDITADELEQLTAGHSWVGQGNEMSVTEAEFRHAGIKAVSNKVAEFYFLRDASDSRISSLKADITDVAQKSGMEYSVKVSEFGVKAGTSPAAEAIYDSILRSLRIVLPDEFNPVDHEFSAHKAFYAGLREAYSGNESQLDAIEASVSAGNQATVVSGAMGSGKSALIANWISKVCC